MWRDVVALVVLAAVVTAALLIEIPARARAALGPIPDATAQASLALLVAVLALATAWAGERRRSRHTRAELQVAIEKARRDPLTGVPHRGVLVDVLLERLTIGPSPDRNLAVLFLDLDRYKAINDVYGHALGDQLLADVADRLASVVREGDLLVRYGGDEFVVLAVDLQEEEQAERIAERLTLAMTQPFAVNGNTVSLSLSIGIAVADRSVRDAHELLRRADTAMYRAKAKGRACHVVYHRGLGRLRDRHAQLWERVDEAFTGGELFLDYQPIHDLETGDVHGVEALLRWDDPAHGPVSPIDFVPILEETGRIVDVGTWVLTEACEQARRWRSTYDVPDEFAVSVNVSGVQLQQADFADAVTTALRASDLEPSSLCLEITEATLLHDLVIVRDALRSLSHLGVQVALDDFGTGYSSISHVRNFALNQLKIDRTFVRDLGISREDTEIVAAVVSMANALGVRTVAEGVETVDQVRELRRIGCPLGQGFHWSKPRPISGIDALLEQRSLARFARS